VEAEHCFARTAALLQYFLAEARIEADYCHIRNLVLSWRLQSKDSRAVAEEYCIETVIETAVGTDWFDQRPAGRLDPQEAAGLHSGLEKALSIERLCERYTFRHR
jgi:hypothetical protein